jgi:hypothetical protein
MVATVTQQGAVILVAFLGVIVGGRACTSSAHASSTATDRAVLANARACVGEVGWNDFDACAAVVGVHMRRAELTGVSVERMAELYSQAIRRPRRLWVPVIDATPRRPAHFPEQLAWSRYRDRFAAIKAHVRGVLEGDVADPCETEAPLHYGSVRLDGIPRGHVRTECLGDNAQAFYKREGDR